MGFAISTRTRYAVRLMTALAKGYGREPQRLSTVSMEERISAKYLSQIIIPLKAAGLVEATRGAKGGYALRRNPETISILEIAETMEGPVSVVPCVSCGKAHPEIAKCELQEECSARPTWKLLNRRIRETLADITLTDMVTSKIDL